jgi:hypothetical protein
MTTEPDPIPIIALEEEVRDIAYGVTGTEYSSLKIATALKYGSALVCTRTGIYDWKESNPQYHIAVQAANYLAVSNVIPKTFRDPDTGKSYWSMYNQAGLNEINGINEGVVDLQGETTSEGFIKVISSPSKNYYRNRKASPYKAVEGWTGAYNKWNPENYTLEKIK